MKKLSDAEVKRVELDILLHIRQVCRKHGLRYYLAWGTLLGAVRHKGFIPWDDDVDIMMPRSDYDRFLQIFGTPGQERYKILCNSNDKKYYYAHAKVVDTRTSCKEKGLLEMDGMGVWVDVFPLDGMPSRYKAHYTKMYVLHKIRALSVHDKMPEGPAFLSPLLYALWKTARKIGYQRFIDKMERLARRYDYGSSDFVSNVVEPEARACVYRKEVFASSVPLPFEGEVFDAPILYEEYLKRTYGKYMQLPPLEKRTGHAFDAYWKQA